MFGLDTTQLLFITAFSALATSAATVILALYKRQERSESRRGYRYKDISPTGFALLKKTYRRVDCRFDRILDFGEALKGINEASGLSDSQKTEERLRSIDAVKTLVRTDCLRKRDGDGNIYAMTERGLQVREYHLKNRWWKIWLRPPL